MDIQPLQEKDMSFTFKWVVVFIRDIVRVEEQLVIEEPSAIRCRIAFDLVVNAPVEGLTILILDNLWRSWTTQCKNISGENKSLYSNFYHPR